MTDGERQERRFGRLTDETDEGLLTYGSYLKIPELLSLQELRSNPAVHDELLFIVVHQAYELWFKQLVFELEAARDAMVADRTGRARHLLARVRSIERVLIEHIQVLQTMAPQDFLEFRAVLTPASGFQSAQFREMEFLSGLKDERFLDDLATDSAERDRLERRLRETTMWDGFVAMMQTHGFPMPDDDAEARAASLVAMARERGEVFAVSEGLMDHDETLAQWRFLHVLMVEREIGAKRGTGGSSGVGYLRSTLDKRCFPELWGLRSRL
jgi:tryptophan 2,3-dioxygenase